MIIYSQRDGEAASVSNSRFRRNPSIKSHDLGLRIERNNWSAIVNDNIGEVTREVHRVLATLTPRGTYIRPHHRLLADLKLLSDDATAMALDLERKFAVRIRRSDWQTVSTVQDVIDLVSHHLK